MRKLEHMMVLPSVSVDYLNEGDRVKRLTKEDVKRMRSKAIETAGAKVAIQRVIFNAIGLLSRKLRALF